MSRSIFNQYRLLTHYLKGSHPNIVLDYRRFTVCVAHCFQRRVGILRSVEIILLLVGIKGFGYSISVDLSLLGKSEKSRLINTVILLVESLKQGCLINFVFVTEY